jgi:DNA-binding transcriptional regulator/RsmH inhibitor MraZ
MQKATTVTKTTVKNDKVGRLTFPDSKTSYNAIVDKTVWYLCRSRKTDQWDWKDFRNKLTHTSDN